MDWKEISKENPKAIQLFEKSGYTAALSRQKRRLLYDFFDENNVYIKIWLADFDKESMTFTWYIFQPGSGMVVSPEEYYTNRASAEEAAFEAAFKILNKKL